MILIGLIIVALVAGLNAAPLAFVAMLFLGNVGVQLSFWAVLPGALAVKFAFHNIFSAPANTKP